MADGGAPDVRQIPRGLLDPDPGNPRRASPGETFDVSDLVGPIRALGITCPLLVTPRSGRFMIIEGERRYAATGPGHVDLQELPCIVRDDLGADEILELQLASFTRAPLPPLQEARAFKRLLDSIGAGGVGDVADRLGKAPSHVRRRLLLLDLVPDAQQLLAEGGVTLDVAQLLAGIAPDGQREVVTRCRAILAHSPERGPLRRIDVGGAIEGQRRRLASAPWKLDDKTMPGGACVGCPKQTAAQLDLVDAPKDSECTDRKCFEAKEAAWRERRDDAEAERTVGPEKAAKGREARGDAFQDPKRHLPVVQDDEDDPPPREPGKPLPKATPKGSAADDAKLERQADDAARGKALAKICSAMAKRKPDDKFWRLLAGLVTRTVAAMYGDILIEALDRRGIEARGGMHGARDRLLAETTKASENECRGLIVELLAAADETGDDDDVFALACRAAKVDHGALLAEERERLTKAKPAPEPKGKRDLDEEKVLRAAAGDYRTAAYIATKTGLTIPAVKKLCGKLAARGGDKGLATRYVRGEDDSYRSHYPVEAAPTPPVEKGEPTCPITWPDVVRLAKLCKFKPHEGAQSPENVWGCIGRIRTTFAVMADTTREVLYEGSPSSGTGSVDLAIVYLLEAAEISRAGGKGPKERFIRVAPGQSSREAEAAAQPEAVRLEGDARKAAEARTCPKCSAKAGKGCVSDKGKLGTGWVHRERAAAPGQTTLTEDQRKVLSLVAEGVPFDEIDKRLGWPKARTNAVGDSLPEGLVDMDFEITAAGLAALAPAPPKPPPTASTVRSCRVCGCSDAAACQDDHPASEAGECTWTEPDLCSVCARCSEAAFGICQRPQSRTALLKALTTARGKGIEAFDPPRAKATIADLEKRGALAESKPGKLLASQPVAP